MIQGDNWQVHIGSNLDVLPTLPDNSVDSIVTDPPYELGFMGKKWDSSGIAYSTELWKQCLRVLKPGGHLLSFGGTRTWHRVAVAIEDSGFEVRDSIAWMYGSGFPKSLNVGKATESEQWKGWGTALKPAHEPIVVARKPLIGTVAETVLTHGTGGLNIDGSRIGTEGGTEKINSEKQSESQNAYGTGLNGGTVSDLNKGRWPANVILDPYTAELLDEQSGVLKSGAVKPTSDKASGGVYEHGRTFRNVNDFLKSEGGASRFFYVAKASKRDRNEGLEELEGRRASAMGYDIGLGEAGEGMFKDRNPIKQNFHPTVKPTALMRYLVKLVTPPGGVVLDPFTGSGSTGKAAILEGFDFIGIELTEDYIPIIEGRLKHGVKTKAEEAENLQLPLEQLISEIEKASE